jgi:hypothetical protein
MFQFVLFDTLCSTNFESLSRKLLLVDTVDFTEQAYLFGGESTTTIDRNSS